jgi:hypothetical protein
MMGDEPDSCPSSVVWRSRALVSQLGSSDDVHVRNGVFEQSDKVSVVIVLSDGGSLEY